MHSARSKQQPKLCVRWNSYSAHKQRSFTTGEKVTISSPIFFFISGLSTQRIEHTYTSAASSTHAITLFHHLHIHLAGSTKQNKKIKYLPLFSLTLCKYIILYINHARSTPERKPMNPIEKELSKGKVKHTCHGIHTHTHSPAQNTK